MLGKSAELTAVVKTSPPAVLVMSFIWLSSEHTSVWVCVMLADAGLVGSGPGRGLRLWESCCPPRSYELNMYLLTWQLQAAQEGSGQSAAMFSSCSLTPLKLCHVFVNVTAKYLNCDREPVWKININICVLLLLALESEFKFKLCTYPQKTLSWYLLTGASW